MSFDFKADSHWDAYPAGLKVLAVDDDPLCLKVVAEMLKRCNYEGEMLLPPSVAALLLGELSATVTSVSAERIQLCCSHNSRKREGGAADAPG